MEKVKLMVLPLSLGLILIVCSWFLSYPLSIDTPYDFIFNHVSPLYWLGLPLFLASLYVTATFARSRLLKFVICAGIVASIYSINYFYFSFSSSDAQFSRGLTEYYGQTGDLNPSKPHHSYFQWPLFFILNKAADLTTSLETMQFEFVLFATLGVLYVACLYSYAARFSKDGSYIATIIYFIIMYWFLNYQFAPFSLAIGLLYALFTLETHVFRTREVKIASMILFISITLVHPFAAVFFIVYTFVMYVTSRDKNYLQQFLFGLIFYLVVLVHSGQFFPRLITQLMKGGGYYGIVEKRLVSGTAAPAPPITAIAQSFSRSIVILAIIAAGLGFLALLIRHKARKVDYALFISAVSYIVVGSIIQILGWRGLFLLFIPVSLGTIHLMESKIGRYIKCFILVLIILFPFVLISQSFGDAEVVFQTRENYQSINFMLSRYNWNKRSTVLSHLRVMRYLQTKSSSEHAYFGNDLTDINFTSNISHYDSILYTVGLGKSCLRHNCSLAQLLEESILNRVFDSGLSYITIRANSSYNTGN